MARRGISREAAGLLAGAATRRQALGLLGGLGAIAWRVPRVAARDATPAAKGAWTFTDDVGKTVILPERPVRIAADLNAASALWDFGIEPVAISGWTVGTDASWGNVDRDTPNITVSAETSEPNLEALLDLGIDLFVTVAWGNNAEAPYEWSFPEAGSYERTNEVVPVIAISTTGRADENMLRFAELAESLGADLDTPELAEAKAAYETARAEFERMAQEKAGLTSLFVYADGTAEYVAYPPIWADLAMYQALGLNVIVPENVPENEYWEELSPEQAATYISDILFQSTRLGIFTPEELTAHATYGSLPAVKAGQIASWNQDFIQSYQGLTAALDAIVAALEGAQDVTP